MRAALESRQTRLVSHLAAEQYPWLAGALPSARNLVLVPLTAETHVIGVIVVEHGLRRAFGEALPHELTRADRTDEPATLLLVDIDHFKRINDTLGHQTGDEVLRSVAAVLAGTCRDDDFLARHGGEEFAVILPGTDTEEGLAIAESLREAVALEAEPAITVSVGAATFPFDAVDTVALIAAADEALYASKRAGRDRVTASGTLPRARQ